MRTADNQLEELITRSSGSDSFLLAGSWAGLTPGATANMTQGLRYPKAFVQMTSAKKVLGFSAFQWKENLTLTETQVQALALNRKASQELDLKHREAIYNDVLGKQQMVKYVYLSTASV